MIYTTLLQAKKLVSPAVLDKIPISLFLIIINIETSIFTKITKWSMYSTSSKELIFYDSNYFLAYFIW